MQIRIGIIAGKERELLEEEKTMTLKQMFDKLVLCTRSFLFLDKGIPSILIATSNEKEYYMPVEFTDDDDKQIVCRSIVGTLKKEGIQRYMFVSDAFIRQASKEDKDYAEYVSTEKKVKDAPDRKDCIVINGENKIGETYMHVIIYEKKEGKISIVKEIEKNDGECNLFKGIFNDGTETLN